MANESIFYLSNMFHGILNGTAPQDFFKLLTFYTTYRIIYINLYKIHYSSQVFILDIALHSTGTANREKKVSKGVKNIEKWVFIHCTSRLQKKVWNYKAEALCITWYKRNLFVI